MTKVVRNAQERRNSEKGIKEEKQLRESPSKESVRERERSQLACNVKKYVVNIKCKQERLASSWRQDKC